jgi:NTP pyrophosphohydrolases including oxidative damage repair enzymes
LLKQFRHAIDRWIWELPAGKLEDNEAPELTAMRELEEESGYTAKDWQDLGMIYSSPGVFNEKLYLYLAQSLTKSETNLESHEFIEVHWISLESAYQWALNNTINDAKSVISIIRAYQYLTKHA